ncbi:MAG: hypothetical protein BWY54_00173 [Candidatus Dependentiae bacterium ADurb.Bin331]|nr:MAG: hypothetical protein BWY54_00173 [Candidatus Dependentiae bacterium ADurb.Bin331]
MKRVLLLTFLAICAIDAHAMEKKTQPFISVKQVVGAYGQIYSKTFRDTVNEFVRKLKMNAPESELRKFSQRFREEVEDADKMESEIAARIRVSRKEIAESPLIMSAEERLKENIQNATTQIERAMEAYKKRNPGSKLGAEERGYTMDFTRAKKEAGQINQKLAAVRDAGKTFSKQQCDELNAVAQIAIF